VPDLGGTMPVGAVHQQQNLACARHEAREHRLDGEGAAALQRDAYVGLPSADDIQQHFAHAPVDGDEAHRGEILVHPDIFDRTGILKLILDISDRNRHFTRG